MKTLKRFLLTELNRISQNSEDLYKSNFLKFAMADELKEVLDLASETSKIYYHLETLCLCFPGRIR